MQHGDGGKGSGRRPGQGFQDGWDRIFGQHSNKATSNDRSRTTQQTTPGAGGEDQQSAISNSEWIDRCDSSMDGEPQTGTQNTQQEVSDNSGAGQRIELDRMSCTEVRRTSSEQSAAQLSARGGSTHPRGAPHSLCMGVGLGACGLPIMGECINQQGEFDANP